METIRDKNLSIARVDHVRSNHGRWIFKLELDNWEHLQLIDASGTVYRNINVIPLFPLSAPEQGISILTDEFDELLCLADLSELDETYRELIRRELKFREFVPVIERVISVSGKTEPCEWIVDTNHGTTRFVLKAEEDVHRISNESINILDANGMRFRVENLQLLDKRSRSFIEWYV